MNWLPSAVSRKRWSPALVSSMRLNYLFIYFAVNYVICFAENHHSCSQYKLSQPPSQRREIRNQWRQTGQADNESHAWIGNWRRNSRRKLCNKKARMEKSNNCRGRRAPRFGICLSCFVNWMKFPSILIKVEFFVVEYLKNAFFQNIKL